MLKSIVAFAVLLACTNLQAAERTLYAFQQDGCAACKEMEPVLKKLERRGVKVVRIDIKTPKGRALVQKYKVKETPTYISVDKAGREQGREVGVVTEGVLLVLLKLARYVLVGLIKLLIM